MSLYPAADKAFAVRALVLLKVSKCILHYLGYKILPPYLMNFIIEIIDCCVLYTLPCLLFPTAVLQKVMKRQHSRILKNKALKYSLKASL